MARKVVIRRQAENRLAELVVYITNEAGAAIAHAYVDRIYALCQSLADFPERGRQRDDLLPGLRTVTMERRTTVIYRVRLTRVEVLTVAYGGRDFEAELR